MTTLENYNDFITHSSIDEHLGCFPMLAIVNNAAINRDVLSSKINVFVFFKYPEVE